MQNKAIHFMIKLTLRLKIHQTKSGAGGGLSEALKCQPEILSYVWFSTVFKLQFRNFRNG